MTILFQPAPEGTTHFLRFASGHVVWCKVEQGDNNQLILKEWDSFNQFWVPGNHAVEHYQSAGLMSIDDFPGEAASPTPDNAPAGATHYYSHGGEMSWYRETDNGLSVWRDGSWYASTYKTALDLAKVCPLGAVSTFGEDKQPEQAEDDLTWLARDVHEWKDGCKFVYALRSTQGVFAMWLYDKDSVCQRNTFTRDQWLFRRAELQNKPSWKDAPEWARYLAQSDSGTWRWFDGEPEINEIHDSGEFWGAPGYTTIIDSDGEVLGDWRDTLERRPSDLSEPAVTERLTEAAQTVTNGTAPLEQPVAVTGTGDASSANAWRSLHEWITDEPNNPQMALMERISSELHNDGCFSAWIHLSRFIEALFERIDELGSMTSGITDRQDEQQKPDSDWFERGELPPVGVVCEAYIDYPPQWVEAEIVAHKDGFAIGWCKSVMKGCHGDKASEFRPIRTERDELLSLITSNLPGTAGQVADAILAAGFKRGEA